MKTKIITSLLVAVAIFAGGCASTNPNSGPVLTPEKVKSSVDSIVGTFTIIKLRQHPESKVAFIKARDSINVLVAEGKWDVNRFGEVIASTGLIDGAGENVGLYITTGVQLINLVTNERIDLSKVEYVKAVIEGGASALNRTVKD